MKLSNEIDITELEMNKLHLQVWSAMEQVRFGHLLSFKTALNNGEKATIEIEVRRAEPGDPRTVEEGKITDVVFTNVYKEFSKLLEEERKNFMAGRAGDSSMRKTTSSSQSRQSIDECGYEGD